MKINEGTLKFITHKKNMTSQFEEHCTKLDDISVLLIMHLFLSQTILVCESNHSLLTYLAFDF